MATTARRGFRLLLRRGNPHGRPRAFVDRMYDDFDRTTRRAVLELYRSVPDVASAGERLAKALRPLDRPALALWGRRDPVHTRRPCRAPARGVPAPRDPRGRAKRPLALVDDQATVSAALTGFLARHADAPTGPVPDAVASLSAGLEQPEMSAAAR